MIYTSVSYIKKAHKVSKETVSICTKRDENSSIFLKKNQRPWISQLFMDGKMTEKATHLPL